MSNTPQIRFAGFTDAWEQRELGSVSEKVTKKNQDMVCDEVFTNSAEYGIISQRDFFDKDIANSENIDGYYIVEPNDFVYNPRISNLAPFGPIRRNKLEKSGAMSPLYYVFRTHGVDYGFLEYYFKTNGWHSFMHLNGNSGARSDRFAIRDDVFREMPITMPQNVVEQQAIGKYFTNLDNLITLHQRKCDALQKFKKSMLQKMFPQNGESVPEIRFAGFTDAWEQRKLGDICPTFLDGDWIESKDQSDSGVRLIQTGNIGVGTYIEKEDRAKWVSEDTFNRLHCEEVFAGDILISRLPEPAGRACIVPETGLKMITAVDVTIARTSDEYDSNFILQFLCSDNYFKAVGNTLSGSTRQRISRSNLEQIPVPIAPTMQEQEQVGAFFSQLDNLITLHQRKLETLQKMKKSLLQKMFV